MRSFCLNEFASILKTEPSLEYRFLLRSWPMEISLLTSEMREKNSYLVGQLPDYKT